ncbi:hypothetical protein TNCV_598771 [Trichonephila clavipes]|nr:hypothetical protein TNCV_598771 [Trichonephila clavipes]
MLLSFHLMTRYVIPVNVFSLMGTSKCRTGLNLLNRGMWNHVIASFGEKLLLPFEIDVLERCHAEDTSRHSARTKAVYDEQIPSNDIFEKCVEPQRFLQVFCKELFKYIQTPTQYFKVL